MSGNYKSPSPLLTVKTRPLPEDMSMDLLQETSITKYTKHYYIGTERIASALGTMNNIGLLCENVWPGSQDIIDEMGGKTMIATEVLEAIHDTFEKELQLPEPYLYETYICTKLEHEPDNYDAYWYHPDHLGSSSYITNLAGDVSQHMEYLPFGETLVEEHLNSYNSPYRFNAKELDEETGWYYYGARYYNPKWSIWLSVDPLAEKFPSWSPHNYTFQNPINFTDPTGMGPDDVIIKGEMAEEATAQLDASTSLNIIRNAETGKLSATGEAVTKADKALLSAINDENITVTVNTTDGFQTQDGRDFVGGAFGGSTVNKDGTVDAKQTANPEALGKMDEFYGRGEGVGMMHEAIEAYTGAQDSPGSDAAKSEQGVANYRNAHTKAGSIDPRYSNNTGKAGFSDVSGNIGGGKTRTTRIYHAKKDGKTIELGRRSWETKNP